MENLKGIIFDYDGTLADTLPLCILAFQLAYKEVTGKDITEEEITRHFGKSEEGIIAEIAKEHYDKALFAYVNTYKNQHHLCPKPFDGVVEILESINRQGIKCALITGKGKQTIDIALDYMNLRKYFEYVEHGHPQRSIKTESMLKIADLWGLKPSEIAYVGDQPSDIIEARAAGAVSVAVSWAKTSKHEKLTEKAPDKLFAKIDDFKNWLGTGYAALR